MLGLDVVKYWRWDDLMPCKLEAATAIGVAKRKDLEPPLPSNSTSWKDLAKRDN